MISIDQDFIDQLINTAKDSPRKRAIHRLHQSDEELVHRMVNALTPGTYVQPHKHENPDKVELFGILKGSIACLQFSDSGDIDQTVIIDQQGPVKIIDIPPRTYHCLVALEDSAALEIIQGPYHPDTHKQFADWAPSEQDTEKAQEYLKDLTNKIQAVRTSK